MSTLFIIRPWSQTRKKTPQQASRRIGGRSFTRSAVVVSPDPSKLKGFKKKKKSNIFVSQLFAGVCAFHTNLIKKEYFSFRSCYLFHYFRETSMLVYIYLTDVFILINEEHSAGQCGAI